MPEEQSAHMVELGDGEVGSQRGLLPFLAHDADAYIGCLDHAYVVASVSDGRHGFLHVCTQELDDTGLVRGRAATAHHHWTLARKFHKL